MPEIRELTDADVDGCLRLAVQRGWPPERRKWSYLLEFSEGYGAFDADGELVGTTLLTRYGEDAATISMVLVARHCERMGIGGRLMKQAMAAAGDVTVMLYATDVGRPLYERLGFRAVGGLVSYLGRFTATPDGPPITRPARRADLGAIVGLDTAATGFDRGPLLGKLDEFADLLAVMPADGEPTGYGAIWFTVDRWTVGPVIAEDHCTARRIITELAASREQPVRIDLNEQEAGLRAWAEASGMVERVRATLMIHGARIVPGERDRLIAPFMQALG